MMNFFSFSLIGSLFAILIISGIPNSFSESENVYWQLVYVTDNLKCVPSDTVKTNEFFGITKKYFDMYEFENVGLDSKCMLLNQASQYTFPDNVQLAILIFDDRSGKSLFTRHGFDGLYSHLGDDISQKHTIMIKDSPSFASYYDSTDPAWQLTNNLSKFILSYKGYSHQEIQRILQPIQMQYGRCVGFDYTTSNCDSVRTHIKPDKISKYFTVMTPVKKAVGNQFINHLPTDLTRSETILNLHREITIWWINDKITNDEYSKSVKYLVNAPPAVNNTKNFSTMEMPNGFIMLDMTKTKKEFSDVGPFQAFAIENEPSKAFSYIPFTADEISKESSYTIPDWFKMRAKLWSEHRISDTIYFDGLELLIRASNSK